MSFIYLVTFTVNFTADCRVQILKAFTKNSLIKGCRWKKDPVDHVEK